MMFSKCHKSSLASLLWFLSFFNSGLTQDFQLQSDANIDSIDVGRSSTPTFTDIDNDGDLDLFIGSEAGNISFFRNTGSATNHNFVFETQNFLSLAVGTITTPTFVDIDNDGDLDLFVGEHDGNLNFFRNSGTATNPDFELATENIVSTLIGSNVKAAFGDVDNDQDQDLFLGESFTGKIIFFRNTGSENQPQFTQDESIILDFTYPGSFPAPVLADIDEDGDLDLIVGERDGNVNLVHNTGTATDPSFELATSNFAGAQIALLSTPALTDIDKDGDLDLFVGEEQGQLSFYRNLGSPTSVSSPETELSPETFIVSQNFPNPFNPTTTIQYQLPKSTQVRLVIYNLVGQKVTTLVSQKHSAGIYSVQWDGKDDSGNSLASGTYFYKLQADNVTELRRMSLIR